jgi:hypothetical protein
MPQGINQMRALTPAQKKGLQVLGAVDAPISAYGLELSRHRAMVTLATLDALAWKGHVEKVASANSFGCRRMDQLWVITRKGKRELAKEQTP